jgi:arylsulfatase A-like enzyme
MNVILIILDSLRADHVGCYGNKWIRTPTLDALAVESAVFTRAFPESLPTIPMRRAIHTGKRTFPFRDWAPKKGDPVVSYGWQPIPEDQVTLAETLGRNGYHTVFITDTFHQFKPSMNFHRGFAQWHWIRGQEADFYGPVALVAREQVEAVLTPQMQQFGPAPMVRQYLANQAQRRDEEDFQAPRVFRAAMRCLEENQAADNLFLLVDSFDPHEPWDPPRHYVDLYDPDYHGREVIFPPYGPNSYLSEVELKHMRALYAAEVTMVDHWLGRFLDRARSLGLLDRSLVIVTSDHGHQLGEHGVTGKVFFGLFNELMDVPLVIRHPDGTGAGLGVDAFVQHHDIPATILALLGIESEEPLEGVNLWDFVDGPGGQRRPYVTAAFSNYVWCRDQRYAYIARNDGKEARLYDMEADPEQLQDIAVAEPEVCGEMFQRVLDDAGGPLPNYPLVRLVASEWLATEWYRLHDSIDAVYPSP